jgi:hypothetical protein
VLEEHMLPVLEDGFGRIEERRPVKVKRLEKVAA